MRRNKKLTVKKMRKGQRRLLKTSSRRLSQDEYIRLSHTSSEDVLKTFSKRLDQDQYIRLTYVFKTSCKNVLKTSSRRFAKTSSRHLQDMLQGYIKDVFKTSIKQTVCLGHTSEKLMVSVENMQV